MDIIHKNHNVVQCTYCKSIECKDCKVSSPAYVKVNSTGYGCSNCRNYAEALKQNVFTNNSDTESSETQQEN